MSDPDDSTKPLPTVQPPEGRPAIAPSAFAMQPSPPPASSVAEEPAPTELLTPADAASAGLNQPAPPLSDSTPTAMIDPIDSTGLAAPEPASATTVVEEEKEPTRWVPWAIVGAIAAALIAAGAILVPQFAGGSNAPQTETTDAPPTAPSTTPSAPPAQPVEEEPVEEEPAPEEPAPEAPAPEQPAPAPQPEQPAPEPVEPEEPPVDPEEPPVDPEEPPVDPEEPPVDPGPGEGTTP